MAGDATNTVDVEEQLKSALWYAVGKIVDNYTLEHDINADNLFIAGLTELVWAQIGTVGRNLEAYADHAGRNVINVKDAVLLGLNNEDLKSALQAEAEAVQRSAKTS